MTLEKISFAGWNDCIRIRHRDIEMLVAKSFGPRILRFGMINEPNLLHLRPDQIGLTGGTEWRIYGGHRLWHAPEEMPRTYSPDNNPVDLQLIDDGIKLIQQSEPETGIQKSMEITFIPEQNIVKVNHRLTNCGESGIQLAPWSLSVLDGEGRLIIPQESYQSADKAFSPVRAMAMWPYTRLHDTRWQWSDKYLQAIYDSKISSEQKLGVSNTAGWMAYSLNGQTLIKLFSYDPRSTYPDFGSNAEVYIDGHFIEMETLGPLVLIPPGGMTEHAEYWTVEKIPLTFDDASIDAKLLPRIKAMKIITGY